MMAMDVEVIKKINKKDLLWAIDVIIDAESGKEIWAVDLLDASIEINKFIDFYNSFMKVIEKANE